MMDRTIDGGGQVRIGHSRGDWVRQCGGNAVGDGGDTCLSFVRSKEGSESKFIWMRFLNSDQREVFGAKSIIAAKPVIT